MKILALVFCFFCILFASLLVRPKPFFLPRIAFLCVASLAAVWLANPELWLAALDGYGQDSLWSLNTFGRSGVLLISAFLIFGVYWLSAKKSLFLAARVPLKSGIALPVAALDALFSIVIFGVLHSISPQVYYTFYQFIFPDLPVQIVIKSLLNVPQLKELLALEATGSLSDHLSGLAMLGLFPFTLILYAREGARKPGHPYTSHIVSAGLAALVLCLVAIAF